MKRFSNAFASPRRRRANNEEITESQTGSSLPSVEKTEVASSKNGTRTASKKESKRMKDRGKWSTGTKTTSTTNEATAASINKKRVNSTGIGSTATNTLPTMEELSTTSQSESSSGEGFHSQLGNHSPGLRKGSPPNLLTRVSEEKDTVQSVSTKSESLALNTPVLIPVRTSSIFSNLTSRLPARTQSTFSDRSQFTKVTSNRSDTEENKLKLSKSQRGSFLSKRGGKGNSNKKERDPETNRESGHGVDEEDGIEKVHPFSPSRSIVGEGMVSRSNSPMKTGSRTPSPVKRSDDQTELSEDDDDYSEEEEYDSQVIDAVLDLIGVVNVENEEYVRDDESSRASEPSRQYASRKRSAKKNESLSSGCGAELGLRGPWGNKFAEKLKYAKEKFLCGAELGDVDQDASGGPPTEQQRVFDPYFIEALWAEFSNMKASEIAETSCAPIPVVLETETTKVGEPEKRARELGGSSPTPSKGSTGSSVLDHVREKFPVLYEELTGRLDEDTTKNTETKTVKSTDSPDSIESNEGKSSIVASSVENSGEKQLEQTIPVPTTSKEEENSSEETKTVPNDVEEVNPWATFDPQNSFQGEKLEESKSFGFVSDPPLLLLNETSSSTTDSTRNQEPPKVVLQSDKKVIEKGLVIVATSGSVDSNEERQVSPLTIGSKSFGVGVGCTTMQSIMKARSKSIATQLSHDKDSELDALVQMVEEEQTKKRQIDVGEPKPEIGRDSKASEQTKINSQGKTVERTKMKSSRKRNTLRQVAQRFRNPSRPKKLDGK